VQLPPTEPDGPPTSLGLGLYIAHQIVAMHGGSIAAESSAEDGTVFSAFLPRIPTAAAQA
jgi:signal transduction histidine kinase